MKLLLIITAFALLAPPAPSGACELNADQSPMTAEHANMAFHDMDDKSEIDCCDDESADTSGHCTMMSQCGTCAPGLTALIAFVPTSAPATTPCRAGLYQDKTALQYYSPLFRPPIS